MNDDRPLLKPAQLIALAALMEGKSNTQAAAIAGVTRQTVGDWITCNEDFRAGYFEGLEEIRLRLMTKLTAHADEAIEVLRAIFTDKEEATNESRQAAVAYLAAQSKTVDAYMEERALRQEESALGIDDE